MNNYIEHHGIKGMHWGIRRYQNKDGSLTPAGKKRYSSSEVKEARKNLSKERSYLNDLSKRKSYTERAISINPDVANALADAHDDWDWDNDRPLSKQEQKARWDKYEKTYQKALNNSKEYQSVLKEYDSQKTKVSELEKMASTKIGADYVNNTLTFAGSIAAAVFVSKILASMENLFF